MYIAILNEVLTLPQSAEQSIEIMRREDIDNSVKLVSLGLEPYTQLIVKYMKLGYEIILGVLTFTFHEVGSWVLVFLPVKFGSGW